MAALISKKIVISNENVSPDIEVYIGGTGQIVFEEHTNGIFWFAISEDDWNEIKKFIDNRLKEINE